MNYSDLAGSSESKRGNARQRLLQLGVALAVAASLSACGNKEEKKTGQALASVNGEEITLLQLNEEMQRSGVQPAQQDKARKQLLEALIDRQLLQNEAVKDKTDRDPKVVQAIERAKALIVAQAYMQKRIGTPARPSKQEVSDYFEKNPIFFSNRKVLVMNELVVPATDMNQDLKNVMDSAKTLEDVGGWLDSHKVKFTRSQVARATSDLPAELATKLLSMPKGQLFIINEGDHALLVTIAEVRDAPVTLDVASPQIEQFLFNKKNKDAADAELARLRAAAKIEYLNGAEKPAPAAAAAAPVKTDAATERGVAGLK